VRIASEFTGRVKLAVFPDLLEKLVQSRDERPARVSASSRLIKMDPVLCLMALSLDRSMAAADQPKASFSVEEVTNRIGASGIEAIVSQAIADGAMYPISLKQGTALEWLWRHSLTTALLARDLAREIGYGAAEEAYVAGLLLNIGQLALAARTPAECTSMLADRTQALPLLEAEAQVVGSAHNRLGADLIRRHTNAWFAADAAEYQAAAPDRIQQAFPLVQIVWSANYLAMERRLTSTRCSTAAALLHLDAQRLHHLSQAAQTRAQSAADEIVGRHRPQEKHRSPDPRPTSLIRTLHDRAILAAAYEALLLATDHSAVIQVLRQNLHLWLGADNLLILEQKTDDNFFTGRYAAANELTPPAEHLRVALAASDCLPVRCTNSGKMVDSFSHTDQKDLTIIDRQLARYLGKDGILCLPLQSGGGRTVIVVGIDEKEQARIRRWAASLNALAATLGNALAKKRSPFQKTAAPNADGLLLDANRIRKIVHEINNPLGIIKNYLKVVGRRADQKNTVADELRIIDGEIDRLTGLIRSLTNPSKKSPASIKTIDLNGKIKDILHLFRTGLSGKTNIQFKQDADSRIPAIAVEPDLFKQAMVNLLKNATEAMPAGGTITVQTRMLRGVSPESEKTAATDRVKVSVCDDGPGIDETVAESLFKARVSTKIGHSGLGLAIVGEAVAYLNGTLVCESMSGQGTCFHIELPVGGNHS
jgi:signal transduction histidine kinase